MPKEHCLNSHLQNTSFITFVIYLRDSRVSLEGSDEWTDTDWQVNRRLFQQHSTSYRIKSPCWFFRLNTAPVCASLASSMQKCVEPSLTVIFKHRIAARLAHQQSGQILTGASPFPASRCRSLHLQLMPNHTHPATICFSGFLTIIFSVRQ